MAINRKYLHKLANSLAIAMSMLEIAQAELKKLEGGAQVNPKTFERLEKALKAMHRIQELIDAKRKELIAAGEPASDTGEPPVGAGTPDSKP